MRKHLSITSGHVSSRFTFHMMKELIDSLDLLPSFSFDCRIAQWDSFDSAMQLFIFRAHDCYTNGTSIGIHLRKEYKKNIILNKLSSFEKILFFQHEDILKEMTSHQFHGTIFCKVIKEIDQESDMFKIGEIKYVKSMKEISCSLINLIKDGKLKYNEESKHLIDFQ